MVLSPKEKAIALISNGIAAYSLYQAQNSLPENVSMLDFILKAVPENMKPEVTIELIDEVFVYVSTAHSS